MIWCIDSPGFGGSEMDFLDRSGYLINEQDILILSNKTDNLFLESLKETGAHVLFKNSGNTWKYFIPSLFFYIKFCWQYRKKTFVFWTHHIDSNRWLQLFVAISGSKFILAERLLPRSIDCFKKSKLSLPVKRYVVSRSLINIVCGYSQIDNYKSIFRTNRCIAIPNSRKVEVIRSTVDKLRKLPPQVSKYNGVLIVSIGRVCEQKDQLGIVRAVLGLKNKANITLLIVGGGEKLEELRSRALDEKINNVHFLGFDPEPVKWLSIADMFILNSKAEGLPGVLIEAMAANVPCIATNIPGNNELVIHEQTGLLVEEQSPEKLGEAIVRMLSDEQLAKKLAANAFENVAKNYSWQVEKDLWIKLLKEVNES